MIIKGLLFGLTLQLAVGPVFLAVLNKSLQQGWRAAIAMVFGVALADAIYIAVSFTGVSHLLLSPAIKPIITYLAAALLIAFGLSYFRIRPLVIGSQASSSETEPRHFLYGLRLTLANPLTIIFWSCTFSALILTNHLSPPDLLLYAAGCILSTLLFLGATCLLGQSLSGLLKPGLLTYLNYVVGLFLIGFAGRIVLSTLFQ